MIGLDTNILARYYIEPDEADEPTKRQRKMAQQILNSGKSLFVAKTVILELEWVCRGIYKFEKAEILGMMTHLLGLPHIEIEDVGCVEKATEWYRLGLDFADAMHLASSARVKEFITFDKRKFSNRARRLKTLPAVVAA